ncbi:MAG: ABC transporter ATP-binding protein, partial [Caldimonas sp.]
DISIARAFADRVAVMLGGEIVESGPVDEVLVEPRHEYTRRLLAAVPQLDRPAATGASPAA